MTDEAAVPAVTPAASATPTPTASPTTSPSPAATGQTTSNDASSTADAPVSDAPASADSGDAKDTTFEDILLDMESGDEVEQSAAVKAKAPAQGAKAKPVEAAKPVPQKPAEAKAPEVPKAAEAPKAETPKPAESSTPVATEPQKTVSDEERKASYQKWRGDSETKLQQLYQLTPEDGEAMLAKPEAVLPKLAARLHLDVYEAVLGEMQQHLPRIVSTLMEGQGRIRASEDRFFGQFPALKQHEGQVYKFMHAFRQLHPTMPEVDFANQVGLAMMSALKIPMQAPTTQTQQAQPEVVRREVVDPGASTFTPAPTSGIAPINPKQQQTNPYAQLAEEFLQDDAG